MTDLSELKSRLRRDAFARRRNARAVDSGTGASILSSVLAAYRGVPLAGYMPIRTEISPLTAMVEASAHGKVGVPVISRQNAPLRFAEWTPDTAMTVGMFGAQIPAEPVYFTPEIIIVPLVAFDLHGGRLGYGGGFYDRTLEKLRVEGPLLAIGFAYNVQQAEDLPLEDTDQRLDLIVTESGVIEPKQ